MKKFVLSAIAACLISTATNTSWAAGVGYVDYDKIVDSYPLAQKYKSELDKKASDMELYAKTKEREIIKALPDDQLRMKQEAVTEIERMQKDYMKTKELRENELAGKVQGAAEKVRAEQGLDFVLKADTILSGGTDISADVVKKLK